MGGNTSKRLRSFDVGKSRSKALIEDFNNIHQNSHRGRRRPPPLIHSGARNGRTALLNLPDELAGIAEPNPFPRLLTRRNEPEDHKRHPQEFSETPRKQAIRRAQKPIFIEPSSRSRENHPPQLQPGYKPDRRSHYRSEAQPRSQQYPIRDSRPRLQVNIHEQHSRHPRGLGHPTPRHHRRERDQAKEASVERASPGERHSSRPYRTQRMGHGETVHPSPRPHHYEIRVHDRSTPKRVVKKSSQIHFRFHPKNPYTTFKQEPRATYHYPKIGVLNVYV